MLGPSCNDNAATIWSLMFIGKTRERVLGLNRVLKDHANVFKTFENLYLNLKKKKEFRKCLCDSHLSTLHDASALACC